MANSLQILRSNILGNRPAVGGQPYGMPYVNFADKQFGVVDSSQTPQDMVGVPYFSSAANYNAGQPVNYQGQMYVALSTVTAGAWNPVQWSAVGLPVRYDAAQSLTAAQQQQAQANINAPPFAAMAYNGLQINGMHWISQFNGATVITLPTTGTGQYITDMWQALAPTSGVFNSAQAACTIPGIPYQIYLRAPTASSFGSANDLGGFAHFLGGDRITRLGYGTTSAMPITISFYMTATATPGYFAVSLNDGAASRAYVTQLQYTAASGVWQYFQITVPGDTGGSNWIQTGNLGMILCFIFGCGTTYRTSTANAWQNGGYRALSTTGNFFQTNSNQVTLTALTIMPGTVGPTQAQCPAAMRMYQDDLIQCQRFYQSVYTGVDYQASIASQVSTSLVSYNQNMRVVPTLTYTPSTSGNCTLTGTYSSNYNGGFAQFSSTAAGRAYWYGSVTANARF